MATKNHGLPSYQGTLHEAAVVAADGDILVIAGMGSLVIQVEGITTATITPKISIDGSTYYTAEMIDLSDGSIVTSITADGMFKLRNMGAVFFLADLTAWTSGTINVDYSGGANAVTGSDAS